MTRLEFVVVVPSELSAGLRGFTEDVAVEFSDLVLPEDELVELTAHFQQAIAEWFDVPNRCAPTKQEYTRHCAAQEPEVRA